MKGKRGGLDSETLIPLIIAIALIALFVAGAFLLKSGKLDSYIEAIKGLFRSGG
ncbi:hypothetical protein J4447_00140 [Candidatus Pacearchaeota archaeon]|nr:hypothetical protein [Candidatus Pacearchaeota archaeon]